MRFIRGARRLMVLKVTLNPDQSIK